MCAPIRETRRRPLDESMRSDRSARPGCDQVRSVSRVGVPAASTGCKARSALTPRASSPPRRARTRHGARGVAPRPKPGRPARTARHRLHATPRARHAPTGAPRRLAHTHAAAARPALPSTAAHPAHPLQPRRAVPRPHAVGPDGVKERRAAGQHPASSRIRTSQVVGRPGRLFGGCPCGRQRAWNTPAPTYVAAPMSATAPNSCPSSTPPSGASRLRWCSRA